MKKLLIFASILSLVLVAGWKSARQNNLNSPNGTNQPPVWDTEIVDGGQANFKMQLINLEANGYEPFSTSSYTKGPLNSPSSGYNIFLRKQIPYAELVAPLVQAAQQQAQVAAFAGTWQITYQVKTLLPNTLTIYSNGTSATTKVGLFLINLNVINNPDGTVSLQSAGFTLSLQNGVLIIMDGPNNVRAGTGKKGS